MLVPKNVLCTYIIAKFSSNHGNFVRVHQTLPTCSSSLTSAPLEPVSGEAAANIVQAIGYHGQGQLTRQSDHAEEVIEVVSGMKTRLTNSKVFKQSYWLARGDPEEKNLAFEVVNLTRSSSVALFFEFCLEMYSPSTMAGETLKTQKSRTWSSIKDRNLWKLANNDAVQYFVACSLTKSILISWQTLHQNMRSAASFSPSKVDPCLHQLNVLACVKSDELQHGVAELMHTGPRNCIMTTSSRQNQSAFKTDGEEFRVDIFHTTCAYPAQVNVLPIEGRDRKKLYKALYKLRVSICFMLKSIYIKQNSRQFF